MATGRRRKVMIMGATRTVHIRVEGRVQGVGYRAWLASTARAANLSGWVRNRRDGAVEAVLHGAPDEVAESLRACEKGPPDAQVTRVEVVGEGVGAYSGFEVRQTI